MSPKAQATGVLALTVLFTVGPHLPQLVGESGFVVSPWVKLIGALLGSVGAVVLSRLPAMRRLAGADGTDSKGSPGVTLGGGSAVTVPPSKGPLP